MPVALVSGRLMLCSNPSADRIGADAEHDRDGRGRGLGDNRRRRAARRSRSAPPARRMRSAAKLRQGIVVARRPAVFDDVRSGPRRSQRHLSSFAEGIHAGDILLGRAGVQKANHRQVCSAARGRLSGQPSATPPVSFSKIPPFHRAPKPRRGIVSMKGGTAEGGAWPRKASPQGVKTPASPTSQTGSPLPVAGGCRNAQVVFEPPRFRDHGSSENRRRNHRGPTERSVFGPLS